MGLDMYLRGEKFHWTTWGNQDIDRMEDGKRVQSVEVNLGYWRKHPDLHGFIVQTFAGGVDECQKIGLDAAQIDTIIAAVKERRLPKTTGFFFGASELTDDEIAEDVAILEGAKAWLKEGDESPIEKVPIEGLPEGMAAVEIKPVERPPIIKQNVSREVFYQASW